MIRRAGVEMRRQALAVLCAVFFVSPVLAQSAPGLIGSIGDIDDVVLVGIRAAIVQGKAVAILTDPEPAVYVVTFDTSHTLGGTWANQIHVVGGDTILGTFVPMSMERAIVRLRGDSRDTVLTFAAPRDLLRLTAPGAPSFTVRQPYTPDHRWTVMHDGTVAHWRPEDDRLHFIARNGERIEPVDVPAASERVTDVEREHWVQTVIPSEFMGQRVFEPLRAVARKRAAFPDLLPPVLDLLANPNGGVWMRRTVNASGEVWTLMVRDGTVYGSVRFPVGRELLSVGIGEFAVLARNELGVEMVERYSRPAWAP